MNEKDPLKEIEKGIFSEKPFQSEPVWKNLSIGIGVVSVVIVFIYLGVSSAIRSTEYKLMDLKPQKQETSVKGEAYGPGTRPPITISPTKAPSPTVSTSPTVAPTATPTSAPGATATPTSVPPTATPTPISPTPDLTLTPTATPSGQ